MMLIGWFDYLTLAAYVLGLPIGTTWSSSASYASTAQVVQAIVLLARDQVL